MTLRLFHLDPALEEFRATVVHRSADGRRVVLDRTAFYATSGGQPHDTGALGGVQVVDVVEEAVPGSMEGAPGMEAPGGNGAASRVIVHHLAAPLHRAPGDEVEGRINIARRGDFSRQHTGQHLLSALFADLEGLPTVSVHFGDEQSTLDLGASTVSNAVLQRIEAEANRVVGESRPVSITVEDAGQVKGLRKPSTRSGPLRVVTIDGIDRSACGGTHVSHTAAIGPVLLRGTERVRGETRVVFLCGDRALRRSRADALGLQAVAGLLGATPDRAAEVIQIQQQRVKETQAAARRMESELAVLRAAALHASTPPGADGVRRITGPPWALPEGTWPPDIGALQALGQAVTRLPDCLLAGGVADPPAVLLAVSPGVGLHAGDVLRAVLQEVGGRGGGSEGVARGSVPGKDLLPQVVARLAAALPERASP